MSLTLYSRDPVSLGPKVPFTYRTAYALTHGACPDPSLLGLRRLWSVREGGGLVRHNAGLRHPPEARGDELFLIR